MHNVSAKATKNNNICSSHKMDEGKKDFLRNDI